MGFLSPYGLMWNLAGFVLWAVFDMIGLKFLKDSILCELVSCLLDFVR